VKEFTVKTSQHAEFVEITGSVQRVVDESGVEDDICRVLFHTRPQEKNLKKRARVTDEGICGKQANIPTLLK